MIRNSFFSVAISLIFGLFASNAYSADIPGSKDPADIKRYQGTEIIRYEPIAYDRYLVPLGKMTKFDFGTKTAEFEKSEALEGAITRITYVLSDPQRSSLEIFRNYENTFIEAKWEILFKASGKQEFGNSFTHVYESLRDNDQLLTYSDTQGHLLVARNSALGLTAVLFVTKFQDGLKRGLKVEKGDPLIQLDLIKTKEMEQKMVLVSSSEMSKSIEQSGRVSLYGILFDFSKAEVKPESEPTLAQIAQLLKEKADLRLLVVGHTDNVGDFEFNRELSQRRAAAVVVWLSQKYQIPPQRIAPFGASFAAPVASNDSEEGRAKNRRVELVPMVNR